MPDYALAPFVTRPSAAMILTLWDNQHLAFNAKRYKLTVQFQCGEMKWNEYTWLYFSTYSYIYFLSQCEKVNTTLTRDHNVCLSDHEVHHLLEKEEIVPGHNTSCPPRVSTWPWSNPVEAWIYIGRISSIPSQIAKIMGPTWGPPGSCPPPPNYWWFETP